MSALTPQKGIILQRTLILHIGHPKTGTTTLQNALVRSPQALKEHGILYPPKNGPAKHSQIAAALAPIAGAPPQRRRSVIRDPAVIRAKGEALWAQVVKSVAQSDAPQIVLSSEEFFNICAQPEMPRFIGELATLAQNVEVVAYLRDPVSYAATSIQEKIKHEPGVQIPTSHFFKDTLEPLLALDNVNLNVHRFSRSTLVDGDIVTDFVTKYLPSLPVGALRQATIKRNATMSAEAAVILDRLWRGDLEIPGMRAAHVGIEHRELVMRVDLAVDGWTRAAFRPGVDAMIYDQRTDIAWTEKTFGLEFARPPRDATIPPDTIDMSDAAALLACSQDRLDRLWEAILQTAVRDASIWGQLDEFKRNMGRWRDRLSK